MLRLNLLLAVMTAVTVVVSMRVVGLLLISALMIVPVATAQLLTRSFRGTLVVGRRHRCRVRGRRRGHLLLRRHPVGRDDRPARHRRVRRRILAGRVQGAEGAAGRLRSMRKGMAVLAIGVVFLVAAC